MRGVFLFFILLMITGCNDEWPDWYNSFHDNYSGKTGEYVPVVFWGYQYYKEHALFGLLEEKAFVELPQDQIAEYRAELENHARLSREEIPFSIDAGRRYFLVRGITYGPTEVYLVQNSLLVSSHIMTRQDVRPFKIAVIAELDREPDAVYMLVEAAE